MNVVELAKAAGMFFVTGDDPRHMYVINCSGGGWVKVHYLPLRLEVGTGTVSATVTLTPARAAKIGKMLLNEVACINRFKGGQDGAED